jgi:hypothetical protein
MSVKNRAVKAMLAKSDPPRRHPVRFFAWLFAWLRAA